MNATQETRTDAAVIVETALATAEPTPLEPGALYGFRLGDRVEVVDVDEYAFTPRRKRGTVTVHDAASLIAYLGKHAAPQTEVWADENKLNLVAVINAHDSGHPGWGDHRAHLVLHKTDAWLAWERHNGQLLDQVAFAEHVENRLPDFVQPTGADMLELAQSIHANRSVKFESSRRLQSGETQLEYREETQAAAGRKGNLAIPDTFELGLVPFIGAAPYKVTARLRYRITDGGLRIGYTLERPDDILRAAFGDIVDAVAEGTGRTILRGVPA